VASISIKGADEVKLRVLLYNNRTLDNTARPHRRVYLIPLLIGIVVATQEGNRGNVVKRCKGEGVWNVL